MKLLGTLVFLLVAVSAVHSFSEVTFPELLREKDPSGARIVSGWEAELGQFPYQMSLRMVSGTGTVSACGASIIHAEWGLTAAHCTAARVTFVLRAGLVNLTRPYTIFETTEYYNHPLYDNDRPGVVQPNDIGLLKFGRKLEFNDMMKPIRMQRSSAMNADYDGVRLTAAGWGALWSGQAGPENMNWVYLRGDSNWLCALRYGAIIQPSTICASGYNDTTQSTCQGDSGGILTVEDEDGEVSQVGISSFVSGQGCHADMPAGFIRPGHYHEWYREITGIDFDWELEEKPDSGDSGEDNGGDGESEEDNGGDGESEEDNGGDGESEEDNGGDGEDGEDNGGDGESEEDNGGDGDDSDENNGGDDSSSSSSSSSSEEK